MRKKVEDSILRAEILAPTALELEESRRINQKEVVRECNLWDDLSKSNEILDNLAESAKLVDALKDLMYKVICYHHFITAVTENWRKMLHTFTSLV